MGKYKMDRYGLKKKVKIKNKEKFKAKKTVRVGFGCMRNEEKTILGWIKQMDYFCEELHIVLDPDTTDKTLELINNQPIDVKVTYQDKSLGDSDESGMGPKQILSYHVAMNDFVKKNIKIDEWFLTMGGDERYHPHDYYRLHNEVLFAKIHKFNALASRRLLEPLNVDKGQLIYKQGIFYYDPNREKTGEIIESTFAVKWPDISRPIRFMKRTSTWKRYLEPHKGFNGMPYRFISAFPLWHFHKLKHNQILPTSERDGLSSTTMLLNTNNGMIPLIPLTHQMTDWSDLCMLEYGKFGDVKYPALLSTIKDIGIQYSTKLSKEIYHEKITKEKKRLEWIHKNKDILEKYSDTWKNNKL